LKQGSQKYTHTIKEMNN